MTEKEIQVILYEKWCRKRNQKYILPNVHNLFWWECDLISCTQAGYIIEYEIKISKRDFIADGKKRKHYSFRTFQRYPDIYKIPAYFWYVIHGFELGLLDIPEYAGLIRVDRGELYQLKRAPRLHKNKITEKDMGKLLITLSNKYWNYLIK